MLSLSNNHNPNYTAEIVKIERLEPHPNADRLQIATINFQPVVVGINTKIGDCGVYIPVESRISHKFLSEANMFAKPEMNVDKGCRWYIGKNGRVKACKLRWEYSMGLFIPEESFSAVTWFSLEAQPRIFDTIWEELFVWKYELPKKGMNTWWSKWSKPVQSRLVDWQVHLHVDTENLRRNVCELNLEDNITITYKYHWTSATFQNVLVKRKLSLKDKIAKFFWANVKEEEYDVVYSSRRVVKNEWYKTSNKWYYDSDPWSEVYEEIKDKIPKWVCLYWEIVGYLNDGKRIQKGYDYWCFEWEKEFLVYRITFTSPEGFVYNLTTEEAEAYAEKLGLDFVEIFYKWTVENLLDKFRIQTGNWREDLVTKLEQKYNDKDCKYCNWGVPEEWIVLRVERNDYFQAYKLKSRRFLEYETKMLDEESN